MLKSVKKLFTIQKDLELVQLGLVKLAEEIENLKKSGTISIDEDALKKLQSDLKVSTNALESAVTESSKTVTISNT